MRPLPLLAALVLGAATAFVVACGDRNGLIPRDDAASLKAALDQVASATRSGSCRRAQAALGRAQGALVNLPSSVDPRLRQRLAQGIENLQERVPIQCQQQTQTETLQTQTPTTTETTTTGTTTTGTTTTGTTTTGTTTTDTTTTGTTTGTTTEPPPTEPTPTTTGPGGGGTGGTPPGGGSGG